jgi:hypothetical protein
MHETDPESVLGGLASGDLRASGGDPPAPPASLAFTRIRKRSARAHGDESGSDTCA